MAGQGTGSNLSAIFQTLFVGLGILLIAGCSPVSPGTTICLTFPAHEKKGGATLRPDDPEVKNAIQAIDQILTAQGYLRDPDPPHYQSGFVAGYYRTPPSGHVVRDYDVPSVYFRNGRLEILVGLPELGGSWIPQLHQMSYGIQDALIDRYGAVRVKAVHFN